MAETKEEIELRFTYHAPKPFQPEKYEKLRAKAKELAYMINDLCPDGREKSLSLTYLDSVAFFANAAIARRE